jgi:hypothetical protein
MKALVGKLRDLHKQATEERSHYYVGRVIKETIDYLTTDQAPRAEVPCSGGVIKPCPYEELSKLKVEDFNLDVKPIIVYNSDQLEEAINKIGFPAILKTLFGNEEAL